MTKISHKHFTIETLPAGTARTEIRRRKMADGTKGRNARPNWNFRDFTNAQLRECAARTSTPAAPKAPAATSGAVVRLGEFEGATVGDLARLWELVKSN